MVIHIKKRLPESPQWWTVVTACRPEAAAEVVRILLSVHWDVDEILIVKEADCAERPADA